uniref:Uncharacterized protein n=1 Tax=Terrapene triunguis TaxID=2587831 RepID=A0A674JNN0_9SAUR
SRERPCHCLGTPTTGPGLLHQGKWAWPVPRFPTLQISWPGGTPATGDVAVTAEGRELILALERNQ